MHAFPKSESAIRERAKLCGYRICKSRRSINLDNMGDYMLIDTATNFAVLGWRYDASLEQIAAFVFRG